VLAPDDRQQGKHFVLKKEAKTFADWRTRESDH
jgi:hypothetical protein